MKNNSNDNLWTTYESPLGKLAVTGSDRGVSGLYFPGGATELSETSHRVEPFVEAVSQLDEYFAGTRKEFDLQLDLSAGTSFQRRVWQQLQAIPHGQTISYGELARRIGRVDRIRAVSAAIGRNPVPIIVPCHRVIGADGQLTGYLGGLQRKRALLDTEAAVTEGDGAPIEFGPRQLVLL
jgi:methylated-DNA-[protein]-cysteine S-methyltransferase